MAITVSADYARALNATVRSVYEDALSAQDAVYREVATVIPSTQSEEPYAWLGEHPAMREFTDERVVKSLKEYGFTIRNKTWEATIGVKRETLEDEQTGQLRARIEMLAEAAQAHYDDLVFDLINGNGLAYDGVAFYSAAHPVGAGTQGNLTTAAFGAAALKAALGAMRRLPLPNGEPMNVRPSHLLVPPELEWDAWEVLNSAYNPDATGNGGEGRGNALRNRLKLVVSARLGTGTEWHLLDCTHAVRPFIVQQRVAADLSELTENSDSGFLRDEFLYGVRSRDNAGYGLWQYAHKSTGEGG